VEITTSKIQIQEVAEDTAALTEDPTEVKSYVLEVRGPYTIPTYFTCTKKPLNKNFKEGNNV
jgi:hypothetical protein